MSAVRTSDRGHRRHPGTVAALAWVLALPFLYLLPTLVHGRLLGSEDFLNAFGLGYVPGSHVYIHNLSSTDQIEEMMPWAALSWVQVHHGLFPLWNPYSAFGLPLFGNFVSAAMSLPMLISYLGPERLVYDVEVIAKMMIAGTGVLWMCRRLGLGNLPAAFAATAFTLCGSFTAWLGWPMSGTTCWFGWLVGATVLIVRTPARRSLHVAGLAVALAFCIYGGHPESSLIVVACTLLVGACALGERARQAGNVRAIFRPLGALGLSGLAGVALAAPLLLPGVQVLARAARSGVLGYPLPAKTSVNLLFASYSGLPTRGSAYFGAADYYETAAYVGAVVAVLALLALIVRRREFVIVGFGLAGVACFAVTYLPFVTRFLDTIPVIKNGQWTRAVLGLDFCLAVLAGFGLQTILDRGKEPLVRRTFVGLCVAAAALTAGLWFGHLGAHLPKLANRLQAASFLWPLIAAATLLVGAILLIVTTPRGGAGRQTVPLRRHQALALVLFAVEATFLLTATPDLWSSSNQFFPVTAGVRALGHVVGQSRVGFAACGSILGDPPLGILAEANDVYGLSEAVAYDGTVPGSYFSAYYDEVHKREPAYLGFGQFCPSFPDATVARHFGVSYVLAEAASAAPPGDVFRKEISGERLYQVPGGGVVTVERVGAAPDSASATVVANTSPDPAQIRADVRVRLPSTLYLHVTDFPGWSATVDGRPLALRPWGGTMLAASLPAGHDVVVVTYDPPLFTDGCILALVAAVSLAGAVAWSERARRRATGRRRTRRGGPVVRVAGDVSQGPGPGAPPIWRGP
jgi:hypothetical protein